MKYPVYGEGKEGRTPIRVEQNIPPEKEYFVIGFDSADNEDEKNKHYRLKIPGGKGLEDSIFFSKPPFDTIQITRGSSMPKGGAFSVTPNDSIKNQAGVFKAIIDIMTSKDQKDYKTTLEQFEKKKFGDLRSPNQLPFTSMERIEHELLSPAKVVVRCYCLKAWDLRGRGSGRPTTFLKLKLGRTKIDDSKNRFKKSTEPDYYKLHEIKAKMPGASFLVVQIWQYNRFKSNKLIGETKIDLEDRFYS